MAERDYVEQHIKQRFQPDTQQEPLVRIAAALEFIAGSLHEISYQLSEVSDATNRVAEK